MSQSFVSQDIIFFTILFAAIFALGALVLGFLAFSAANKTRANFNHRLEILENGLRHYFNNSNEENRNFRGDINTGIKDFRTEVSQNLSGFDNNLTQRFEGFSQTNSHNFTNLRTESLEGREKLENSFKTATESFAQTQSLRLSENNQKLQELIDKNDANSKALIQQLTLNMEKLRAENEQKLEQMRATVDEKLQGTLTERLGEGFKQVSDHLEKVHKGLGEMQNLATGVGDLKRVLTNVKSRGTWGEVQLEMLLQDILTPNQFDKNVRINPASTELVEFAVRLPGKEQDNPIFLAIDAKFPQEDYERLAKAQDEGNAEAVEAQSLNLEKVIKKQAKDIQDKYIFPPYSTDFAIMYLPTEGLFAEIIRRPGLVQEVQSKHRVVITGPTTLAALLNSLQMGFRTLAIEKRSSEVWKILEATKREFNNYGGVMDKLRKQLDTAQKTVTDVDVRTRAINRTLKNVDADQITAPQTNVISINDLIDSDESDAS